VDMGRPDVKEVEKLLVAEKGERLGDSIHAIFAWEYASIVLDAIKAAGSTDRAKVRDAMSKISGRPTLLGPAGTKISFGEGRHDAIDEPRQVVLRVIENGRFGRAIPW
jgi:ABC-type branched-subunit amino acid transport system substrate-binding protein